MGSIFGFMTYDFNLFIKVRIPVTSGHPFRQNPDSIPATSGRVKSSDNAIYLRNISNKN
jgi:hypothetical protein